MPSRVTLTAEPTSIEAGATSQITAAVTPDDATDKTVTFSVDDETIANVSSSGLVTGIKAGTATVTGTCGEVSGTATVTVTDPVTE